MTPIEGLLCNLVGEMLREHPRRDTLTAHLEEWAKSNEPASARQAAEQILKIASRTLEDQSVIFL